MVVSAEISLMSTSVQVVLKGDASGTKFTVKVPAALADGRNVEGLRKHLTSENAYLRNMLAKCYPSHCWQVFDSERRPLNAPIQDHDILILGLPNEPLKHTIEHAIVHQPHHKVMTGSESYHTEEGGKVPSRLLFCEFFDNSIEALRRARANGTTARTQQDDCIELHLVYKKLGSYDVGNRAGFHLQVS